MSASKSHRRKFRKPPLFDTCPQYLQEITKKDNQKVLARVKGICKIFNVDKQTAEDVSLPSSVVKNVVNGKQSSIT